MWTISRYYRKSLLHWHSRTENNQLNVASIIKDIQTFTAQSKLAHCFTGLEAAAVDVVIIDTLMFDVLLFSWCNVVLE